MAYVVKPFGKADLIPAIEVARARFAEIQAVEAEVSDLNERLESRKAVDRAKGLLQAGLGLASRGVPLDPEDGDGPAQVDARGRRGRYRARQRRQEEIGFSPLTCAFIRVTTWQQARKHESGAAHQT
jgi:hypothetical protein